ncbi:hypothetical protein MMC21_002234 [Puttea exsequens]|nr:hypothetical protein [Puttea exsequens]
MPFWLFKVSSSIHSIETPKGVAANRSVINDFGVQASTSVLAAGIYAVVVLGSYSSWLPTYLVTHFDGIRDISRLHNPNFPALVAAFAPIGFAAKVFIFTPSAAAKHDAYEKEIARFNTESATFSEKIVHDLWGFSHRTRVLIQRVAIVAIVGSLQTWLKSYATIEGAEGYGAAGWASVWALAATVTGAAFAWVIDVEEMSG